MNNNIFLSKVFLTLISQLLVTFFVVYYISNSYSSYTSYKVYFNGWCIFLTFIISIFLIFGMQSKKFSMTEKMILFTLFSILFGYMLSPLGFINKNILLASLLGTIGIFVFTFIGGIILTYLKIDLSLLGNILFGSLIGLIIAGLVDLIFGLSKSVYRIYVYIGLIIYSLFVVFDTQNVLKRKHGDDYILSSLEYYLDFLGIFIRLVDINNK